MYFAQAAFLQQQYGEKTRLPRRIVVFKFTKLAISAVSLVTAFASFGTAGASDYSVMVR